MTFYPIAEYDRPEGAPPATHWFWTVGDQWVAVVAEHERDTWWGYGVDDRPDNLPDPWELPINQFPAHGTIVFCDVHGTEFDMPADFEVKPIDADDENAVAVATCGTCHLSWDDGVSTGITPVPSGRCPFEPFHVEVAD